MKTSISWIKRHCSTELSNEDLISHLTSVGLEVENFEHLASKYQGFKIGKILEAEQHPNAEKLKICKVDTGDNIEQIICGAENARSGITVVVATIGSIVPSSNIQIERRKIRGIESCGMICSAEELDIYDSSIGIMELPDTYQPGAPFSSTIYGNDTILDINITPNRGDCASAYGIARELVASGLAKIKNFQCDIQYDQPANIQMKNTIVGICGIVSMTNLTKKESHDELVSLYLQRIGCKAISNLVDAGNFVMHDIGTPIHIYDFDKIAGNIKFDFARQGEEFVDLLGKVHTLDSDIIVVRDDISVISVPGVIGSKRTTVTDDTKNILIESCYLDRSSISKTCQKLNIKTEASFRSERGTDPDLIERAIQSTIEIIFASYTGLVSQPIIIDNVKFQEHQILYPIDTFQSIMGYSVDKKIVMEILYNSNFHVSDHEEQLLIVAPKYRHDIRIKEDIVEEIARLNGYHNIPYNVNTKNASKKNQRHIDLLNVKKMLSSFGYSEMISMSFIDSNVQSLFGTLSDDMYVRNPISANMNYMRSSLLPGLLNIIGHNVHHNRMNNMSIFEVGSIFNGKEYEEQPEVICGVRYGIAQEKSNFESERGFDIFDIKADMSAILSEFFEYHDLDIDHVTIDLKYMHPYKSFCIRKNNQIWCLFGEIHPNILKYFDLHHRVHFFSINLDLVPLKSNQKISFDHQKMQPLQKDLSFFVPNDIKYGLLIHDIRSINKTIKEIKIVDIYSDIQNIAKEQSVTLSITIIPETTQSSDQINQMLLEISNYVQNKYHGKLRGKL